MVDFGGGTLEFVFDGREVEVPAVGFIAVQPEFWLEYQFLAVLSVKTRRGLEEQY